MFASNLSGTHVEMRSLWELVQAKLPRLAAHLQVPPLSLGPHATACMCCNDSGQLGMTQGSQ